MRLAATKGLLVLLPLPLLLFSALSRAAVEVVRPLAVSAGRSASAPRLPRVDAAGENHPRSPLEHLGHLVLLGARRALPRSSDFFTMSREAGAATVTAAAAESPVGMAAQEALRRKFTMSAGGSRKINQKVSSDELLLEEAATDIAMRGGGDAKTTAAALQRMKTKMEQNHMTSSFLAGIDSGVVASVFCAPLDLVRTRMQVMGEVKSAAAAAGRNVAAPDARIPSLSVYRAIADIIKEDGFRGCFRGLGATLATVPLFWGIYFPLYEELKRELHGRYNRAYGIGHVHGRGGAAVANGGQCPAVVHMGSAILAGAVADFVCNPMFLVRTRMQTEALHYFEQPLIERRPHGVIGTIRNLYAEGGIPVFWRGLTASLMGLSHVAIQFPVYEFLKAEARADSPTGEETASDLLLASGIAKMCASLVTYPHEVIRSRMMDARGPHAGKNVFATAKRIVGNEGYGSLYTGIHVSLLRVVPNCCITFMSYELILRWAKEHAAI